MIDPVTTGLVLQTLTAGGFLDCLIGGILGNRVDDFFCKGMAVVRERLIATSGEPSNHDLQRAIRRAYLNATLVAVDHLREEKYGSWKSIGTPAKKDLKRVATYLTTQLRELDKIKEIPKDALAGNTDFLLQPEGKTAQARLPAIIAEMKANVLQEIGSYPRTVEPALQARIRDGWRYGDRVMDWYELVAAFFVEELKTNPRISNTIQTDYLKAINSRIDGLNLDWEPIRNNLDELHVRYETVIEKLDELLAAVAAIGEQLTDIQVSIAGLDDKVQTLVDGQPAPLQKHLTTRPFIPEVFIGREQALEELHRLFFEDKHPVILLSGNGGRGKTTLASSYYHRYEDNYAHLAWTLRETDLPAAVLRLATGLNLSFDPTDTPEVRLEKVLVALGNLPRPSLLVIDDANDEKDLAKHYGWLRRHPNLHTLLTTRIRHHASAQVQFVPGLDEPKTIELFRRYYPVLQEAQHDTVRAIRTAVGANTLVMELLAKNLKANNRFSKKYSLDQLLTDLREKGLFGLSKSKKVKLQYQGFEEAAPEEVVAAMYDLEDLQESERRLLSMLALLPPENIHFADLKPLIDGVKDYEDTLETIAQRGWVEYSEEQQSFRISPVIQEVIRRKNAKLVEDGTYLVKRLVALLDIEELHLNNYGSARLHARYAEFVLRYLPNTVYESGSLLDNMGNYYTDTGDLVSAMKSYSRMRESQEALWRQYPNDPGFKRGVAVSYERIGQTHASLGDLSKTLHYYKLNVELSKSLYDDFPTDISFEYGLALSYEKMGSVYTQLGDLRSALQFYDDSHCIVTSLYVKNTDNIELKKGLPNHFRCDRIDVRRRFGQSPHR